MNRQRLRLLSGTLLFVAIVAAGCADQPPPPRPDAGSGPQAKLLTSLNDVSSTPVNPLAIDNAPAPGEGLLRDVPASSRTASKSYEADPEISRQVGNDKNPATVRLLNQKAAQFAYFSSAILDRIYGRLIIAEKSDEISQMKVPTEIKPVIITAILNKDGKLTELILEQHSGKAKIDKMILDVCRKSIWYENPPPDALSAGGDYRLTIKFKLENFASLDQRHWTFITDLGLGLS